MCCYCVCVFYSVLCYGVCVASSGWGISGAMNCVCPSIVVCVCVWKAVEKVEEEEGGGTEKSQRVCRSSWQKASGDQRCYSVCYGYARRNEKKKARERESGRGGAASACVL